MKVNSIKLSGCDSALRWAIENHAELKDNLPMTSIINDETFFLVRIDDINFYQLFRLTQLYRSRLKVCDIDRTKIPDRTVLTDYFPGYETKVEELLELALGLTTQMLADDDIVDLGIPKLFLPMITTSFSVQIPFSFVDAIDVMTETEVSELFTEDYHHRLEVLPSRGGAHSLIRAIMVAVERSTGNIRYNPKYDKLLQLTKYFPLAATKENDQPFKVGLLSLSKFNHLTRSVVQASFFQPKDDEIVRGIESMANLSTPLELSFAVQLPIYNMQILEAMFSQDDLKISYRSSINNIVDNGIDLEHLWVDDNGETIDNYSVRITEVQLATLKLISELTASDIDFHPSALFALLPPAYRTNAVITFTEDRLITLRRVSDDVLKSMINKIAELSAPWIDLTTRQ